MLRSPGKQKLFFVTVSLGFYVIIKGLQQAIYRNVPFVIRKRCQASVEKSVSQYFIVNVFAYTRIFDVKLTKNDLE